MTPEELVSYLGEPDAVKPVGSMMTSTSWKCGRCGAIYTFDLPVKPPAPCVCGCIGFSKQKRLEH